MTRITKKLFAIIFFNINVTLQLGANETFSNGKFFFSIFYRLKCNNLIYIVLFRFIGMKNVCHEMNQTIYCILFGKIWGKKISRKKNSYLYHFIFDTVPLFCAVKWHKWVLRKNVEVCAIMPWVYAYCLFPTRTHSAKTLNIE